LIISTETAFGIVIVGSPLRNGIAPILLLVLLIRDWKRGVLW
jgi:hypothetical protein